MLGALLNGIPDDHLSLLDRGLHYGDGLFETIVVRDGGLEQWQRHMARLSEGARRIRLPAPDGGLLLEEAERLCGGQQQAILKLILTRGCGGRGYRLPQPTEPSRLLTLWPWPDHPPQWRRDGVEVRWCQTRLGHSPALAGIKHLGRLEQVLARAEWDDVEIAEGLLRDPDGDVIEGTMSNLFLVRNGVLKTPLLDRCGVAGIQRALILDAAVSLGIPVQEERLSVDQVLQADELFVSNRIIGLWPIRKLGEKSWMAPGPITAALVSALELVPR